MTVSNKDTHLANRWPPTYFWRALRHVRNVALTIRRDEYFEGWQDGLPPIVSFHNSLNIVSDYLEVAEQDGLSDIDLE